MRQLDLEIRFTEYYNVNEPYLSLSDEESAQLKNIVDDILR